MKIHNKRENQRIKKAKTIKTIKGTALLLAVILLGIVIVKFCVDLLMASETEETSSKYVDTDTVTWVASFTVSNGVAVYDTDSNGDIIKVPVPAGYVASIIEGETSIKTGFVIYEGDSSIWATYGVGSSTATGASLDYDEIESESTGSEEGTGSAEGEEDIENTAQGEQNNEKTIETIAQEEQGEEENIENTAQEEQSNENVSENINETVESENQMSVTSNNEDGTDVSGTTYSENVQSGESGETEGTGIDENGATGVNGTETNKTEVTGANETEENEESTESETLTSSEVLTEGEMMLMATSEDESSDTPTWVSADDYSVEIFTLQMNVNQYVYVPIEDQTEIYGVDSNGVYYGKLYSFSDSGRSANNWTETNGVMSIKSVGLGDREPDVLPNLTAYDIDSRLEKDLNGITREELLTKEMQQTFYKIVESIKKYGGFYIGRYETGGLSGTAVVKKMDEDIASQTWYVMYEKCKTLGEENDAVATNMIYGSLWDATLEWLVDSGATNSAGTPLTYTLVGSNSTTWGNYRNATFSYIPSGSTTGEATATKATSSFSGTKIPTGSADYTKVNNIYDLAGNVFEWTTEAYSTVNRGLRGGVYAGEANPAGYRADSDPTTGYSNRRVPSSTLY